MSDSPGTVDKTGTETRAHGETSARAASAVRRFRLTVLEGPQAGLGWDSKEDHGSIGSHPSNDLVLADPTISRFHCELRITAEGARLSDLGSKNGTVLDGVKVVCAFLKTGSLVRLGATVVQFAFVGESNRLPCSDKSEFGSLVGTSVAMRTTFALLELAAESDATVLLEGETGTGKGKAAEALHQASRREREPFVVVDCGAIPQNLLESELFGHEKGAFTGAVARRIGAFEEASGGTIFLDEIGELPSEMQPKLLRVLESRDVRRVGANSYRPVDVRLVAATNRDLRAEVNSGRFRPDLYYRLAVVRITLPPLRQRPEDIPPIAESLLGTLATGNSDRTTPLRTPEFLAELARGAWPGNVRELRNYLEHCLVFQEPIPMGERAPSESESGVRVDLGLPFRSARQKLVDEFERAYLATLMTAHQGKVQQAASAAGMDRVYLYRLLRRHGLK